MITIEKSITGKFWDIMCNGILLERWCTKWEAEQAAQGFKMKLASL